MTCERFVQHKKCNENDSQTETGVRIYREPKGLIKKETCLAVIVFWSVFTVNLDSVAVPSFSSFVSRFSSPSCVVAAFFSSIFVMMVFH